MKQSGDPSETIRSVGGTFCLLKNCTLINAPPYWLTWKLMNSGSLIEQNRATPRVSSSTRFHDQQWRKTLKLGKKGLGIQLSDEKETVHQNRRFADDVLLIANSLKQLKK